MGLYDRDYGRDEPTAWDRVEKPRSMAITLIVINVVVFLIDAIIAKQGDGGRESILAPWFAISADTLIQPWNWFQFLTYGFLHDIRGPFHVLFNMIGLYFFGRIIEQRIGQMEFLRFYLVGLFAGGVVGSITHAAMYGFGSPVTTIGASGAVIATVILFALYYPHEKIHLMAVFPVEAWIVAVLYVGMDLLGALRAMTGGAAGNTAFTVHLAGAAFALAYFYQRWNLSFLAASGIADLPARMRDRSRRMKLKLHDPDKKLVEEAEDADRILAKIHKQGESSLTASERKTLERYSRRQREKRNQ
ncbi:Rhomboid family protein [Rubripirellula tenax]|uniref:Rhomboid family protein n=1 Tax=Rubripirellula tenax TaxID=2528015 RepID=A0A5C6F8W0_9BACT|nr:rhomboid family intramembrane serine protease [Rubripirellula tenax]TWU56904.1 Rhomboid family protein [Rubripirellula tenax]